MDEQDMITLKQIRQSIDELEPESRVKVHRCAYQLRAVVKEAGDHGLLALALVGAETEVASI